MKTKDSVKEHYPDSVTMRGSDKKTWYVLDKPQGNIISCAGNENKAWAKALEKILKTPRLKKS